MNRMLAAVFLLGGGPAYAGNETTFGAAAAVQHRRVTRLAGDHIDYRASGPAVVLTVNGATPSLTRGRAEWASTTRSDGTKAWTGRLEAERSQSWGRLYAGSRIGLGGEGTRDDPRAGLTYLEASWAPVAGLVLDTGPTNVRLSVSIPAVSGMVRPGCTMLAPDVLDATTPLSKAPHIPVALYATGPWNHPAIDFTGHARWQLDHGEVWAAVRTSFERANIGHLQRTMTSVLPEVGWSWGGRGGESAAPLEDRESSVDVEVPEGGAPTTGGPTRRTQPPATDAPGVPPVMGPEVLELSVL